MGQDLTSGTSAAQAAAALAPDVAPEDAYEPTGELGAAIRAQRRGVVVSVSDELRAAAARHLLAIDRLCEPARAESIGGWLTKLAPGLVGAPKDTGLRLNIEALIEDCGDLPAGVWVPETRRAYRRANKFWPTSCELYAHLKPYADSLSRQRLGARALLDAPTHLIDAHAEPGWTRPSEEERGSVASLLQQHRERMERDREEREAADARLRAEDVEARRRAQIQLAELTGAASVQQVGAAA